MRTIKTLAGNPLELDGDVLAVIEAVWGELIHRRSLDYGFEEVDREFAHVVSEMSIDELRAYLKESLFMNFNRYESEQMSAIVHKANRAEEQGRQD
jgi:hypothetical protein